ncbi:MAG: hypothetical protein HRT90_06480 [Candidatus Margulisbacteria bacterium]|nr:hypothetical protein [Candidatus Margulisiibacteriota bacterium]
MELKQKEIHMNGHAIEFRINAEDYKRNFMPCPGKITLFLPPGGKGVRIDSHVYPGYIIPPHYDSLLAKLIVWGNSRQDALSIAARALDEFIIDGVPTTLGFFQSVLKHPHFQAGTFNTGFIDQEFQLLN